MSNTPNIQSKPQQVHGAGFISGNNLENPQIPNPHVNFNTPYMSPESTNLAKAGVNFKPASMSYNSQFVPNGGINPSSDQEARIAAFRIDGISQ
jgi:hypothetical protein